MYRQDNKSRSRERGQGRGEEYGRRGNSIRGGNDTRGSGFRGPTVSMIS